MHVVTPQILGAGFWAALEARGFPKFCEAIDIRIRPDEVVKVTATFALAADDGEIQIVEDTIIRATKTLVLVDEAELNELREAIRAHQDAARQPGHY